MKERESTEIVFECDCLNNTRVRANELKMLDKNVEGMYIVIGENNVNSNKRYYNDIEKLEKDYKKLLEIKEKLEKEKQPRVPMLGRNNKFSSNEDIENEE